MKVTHNDVGRRSNAKKVASAIIRVFNGKLSHFIDFQSHISRVLGSVRMRYLEFVHRPSDIFIVTYPRSGTTLMQMLLYQMTTDGNMDFPHISEPCPYFERAIAIRRDLEALPSPRIFKTHWTYKNIAKGPGKYIYIARDGKDVAVSYYHFHINGRNFNGTFSEFFELFMKGNVLYGSWFKHVAEWWKHKDDPNVLWLTYEDLVGDLEGHIKKIGDFCGIEVAPERVPAILESCSIEFMKKHTKKFDPASEMLWESGMMEPEFIGKGQVSGWKECMSEEEAASFDAQSAKLLGEIRLSQRAA